MRKSLLAFSAFVGLASPAIAAAPWALSSYTDAFDGIGQATTSAATSTSSAVLTFSPASPINIGAGLVVTDTTTGHVIGTVQSVGATTVTLTANAAFAVGSGDNLSWPTYAAQLAQWKAILGVNPIYQDLFDNTANTWSQKCAQASYEASGQAGSVWPNPKVVFSLNLFDSTGPTGTGGLSAVASGTFDTTIQCIVDTWATNGLTTVYWRLGKEMNLNGVPEYLAGNNAAWISAFQHVAGVIRSECTLKSMTCKIIWNPGVISFSNSGDAVSTMWPGKAYVDIIGADIYNPIYPINNGTSGQYTDRVTGSVDTPLSAYTAGLINRQFTWEYPQYGSGGNGTGLDELVNFAIQQGAPLQFSIPEMSVCNNVDGSTVNDDYQFPVYLANYLQLEQTLGLSISFITIWDSNGGGNCQWSWPNDPMPVTTQTWATTFGVYGDVNGVGANLGSYVKP